MENVVERVINKFGVIAVILVVISLFLPWWEMYISARWTVQEVTVVQRVNIWVYPYRVTTKNYPVQAIPLNVLIFGLFSLCFLIGGLVLGIAGSFHSVRKKEMFISSGALILFSVITFIVGLHYELKIMAASSLLFTTGYGCRLVPCPEIDLFSTGFFIHEDTSINYSTYLSIGFWLAIIAAIINFVALKKQPLESEG